MKSLFAAALVVFAVSAIAQTSAPSEVKKPAAPTEHPAPAPTPAAPVKK